MTPITINFPPDALRVLRANLPELIGTLDYAPELEEHAPEAAALLRALPNDFTSLTVTAPVLAAIVAALEVAFDGYLGMSDHAYTITRHALSPVGAALVALEGGAVWPDAPKRK